MTSKGSNKHTLRWVLIVLLAIALWGVFAWVYFYGYFGGFTKVKPVDNEEFAKYTGSISDITIPDSVRIIGLGEGYSPLMAFLPMSYRDWVSPKSLYDGVIFVTDTHPIAVLKETEQ